MTSRSNILFTVSVMTALIYSSPTLAKTATASKPASAHVFYIVCNGSPFTYGGQTYSATTKHLTYTARNLDEEVKILKYVNNKWAFNKPADTWSCKKFDGDDIQGLTNYEASLDREGYMAYMPRDDSRMRSLKLPPNF